MNANEKASLGFLNGRWLPTAEMHIRIDDQGFLQAATVVERLRTYGGQLFQFDAHLERLLHSLTVLRIDVSRSHIESVIAQWCERNQPWIAEQGEVGLTIFVTPGCAVPVKTPSRTPVKRPGKSEAYAMTGRQPTLAVYGTALDRSQIQSRQQTGQPIVVTDVQQPAPATWPRSIKVRCRLHYYLADQLATDRHPQALGVLRDADGSITETSIANLGLVRDGAIYSPLPEQVLPGVTEAFLHQAADRHGIAWHHRRLQPEELTAAEEILLFGTTTGVWNGWLVESKTDREAGQDADTQAKKQPGAMCVRLRAAFPPSRFSD